MSEISTQAPATGTTPTTARDAAAATGISIIGAVCGTVLTATFEGSPGQKLTGAIIGAVVATLFSVTGPYLHLRAAVGVVVTGAALVLTYGGATVADAFTGNVTYPRIAPVSEPTPTPTPSTHSAQPDETCEGSLCLSVPPEQALCAAAGCHASIVVVNTGSKLLRIKELEIDGPAAETFRHSGDCANHSVKPGKKCTVVVTVVAEPTGNATLIIHQNLEGPATRVALLPSEMAESRPNLRMSSKASCSISATETGRFTIRTAVRNDGPGGFEGSVAVRVTETGGQTRDFTTTVGDVVLSMPTELSSVGGKHSFTLTVDPDDEVDEVDEVDNIRRVTATLAQGPDGTTGVPCTLS